MESPASGPARPFTDAEAAAESWRCLDCEDAPCSRACPAGIDVRGFIRKIRLENVHGAARRIREADVLGETCAWVCPVDELCEGYCRSSGISHPVSIARLQQYACRYGADAGFEPAEKRHPLRTDAPRPVALVGAGPASLACAAELARIGHRPTVFEKEALAGGVPALAIPGHRLPADVIAREVARVAALGVEIKTGAVFGADFSLDDLFGAGHGAVFLGVGLSGGARSMTPADPGVPVTDAGAFLKAARLGPAPRLSGRVAVVGGGNTAMDAACAALEAGADEVFVLYRRSFLELPAWRRELHGALDRGVEILVRVRPRAYRSAPGGVEVELERMDLTAPDASGRRTPVPVPDSTFSMTFATVLEAVGQVVPKEAHGAFEGVKMRRGAVLVDRETRMTRRAGVFAGGDVVNGGSTVARAVREGREAAFAIHTYLNR